MKYISSILLIKGNKFLYTLNKDKNTLLNIPNFKLKIDENFKNACIRGLKDNVGIHINDKDLILLYEFFNEDYYIKVYISFIHSGYIDIDKNIKYYSIKWLPINFLKKTIALKKNNIELYNNYIEYITI
jgi:hypothetical protein